jgi:hypothetical protein
MFHKIPLKHELHQEADLPTARQIIFLLGMALASLGFLVSTLWWMS